jgi:hypothetical protein
MLFMHEVKGGLWSTSSDPIAFGDLLQIEEEKKHLSHATIDVREIASFLYHNSHCLIIFAPLLTKEKNFESSSPSLLLLCTHPSRVQIKRSNKAIQSNKSIKRTLAKEAT